VLALGECRVARASLATAFGGGQWQGTGAGRSRLRVARRCVQGGEGLESGKPAARWAVALALEVASSGWRPSAPVGELVAGGWAATGMRVGREVEVEGDLAAMALPTGRGSQAARSR
jgi:hypothetical protein